MQRSAMTHHPDLTTHQDSETSHRKTPIGHLSPRTSDSRPRWTERDAKCQRIYNVEPAPLSVCVLLKRWNTISLVQGLFFHKPYLSLVFYHKYPANKDYLWSWILMSCHMLKEWSILYGVNNIQLGIRKGVVLGSDSSVAASHQCHPCVYSNYCLTISSMSLWLCAVFLSCCILLCIELQWPCRC